MNPSDIKPKRNIDWFPVEKDYRAGLLSVSSIAQKHGVSTAGINKRVVRDGWVRDLRGKVKDAAIDKMHNRASSTEEEVIEENGEALYQVLMNHRRGLNRWRELVDKLSTALNAMEVTEDNHVDFARSMNAGVDAQLKIIKGERQAWNLDDGVGEESYEDRLAKLMGVK